MLSLLFGVQSFVTLLDQEFEYSVKHGFGHGTNGVVDLVNVTTLGDEFVTDFDSGFAQSLVKGCAVNSQEFADTFTFLSRNVVLETVHYDDYSNFLPQYHQPRPAPRDLFA